jgi:hypothetical protein
MFHESEHAIAVKGGVRRFITIFAPQDLLGCGRQEKEGRENMQIILSFLSAVCREHKDELLTRCSCYVATVSPC